VTDLAAIDKSRFVPGTEYELTNKKGTRSGALIHKYGS
jgi:hypothetical protein